MTPFNIYLWQQADKISLGLIAVASIISIVSLLLFCAYCSACESVAKYKERGKNYESELAEAQASLAWGKKMDNNGLPIRVSLGGCCCCAFFQDHRPHGHASGHRQQ